MKIKRQIFLSAFYHAAEKGTRTLDPFITSEVLYQLSYFGAAPVSFTDLCYYIWYQRILQAGNDIFYFYCLRRLAVGRTLRASNILHNGTLIHLFVPVSAKLISMPRIRNTLPAWEKSVILKSVARNPGHTWNLNMAGGNRWRQGKEMPKNRIWEKHGENRCLQLKRAIVCRRAAYAMRLP